MKLHGRLETDSPMALYPKVSSLDTVLSVFSGILSGMTFKFLFAKDNTGGTGKSGWERAWCQGNQFPSIVDLRGERRMSTKVLEQKQAGVDLKDRIWGIIK